MVPIHDRVDRQRVRIEPTPLATRLSQELFGGLLRVRGGLTACSEPMLDTIIGFIQAVRAVFSNEIAALQTARALPRPRC